LELGYDGQRRNIALNNISTFCPRVCVCVCLYNKTETENNLSNEKVKKKIVTSRDNAELA